MHDRAAGGEVVGGRSGRRRDDQPVGLHRRHELIADRHRQLDHARQRRAREDHVVQRHVRERRLPLPRRRRAQHHAQIVRGRAVEHGVERREDLRARDLGQESERAEIHGEDRNVAAALGDRLRHRQQRAVAAEHDARDPPATACSRSRSADRCRSAPLRRRQLRRFGGPHRVDARARAASCDSCASVSRASTSFGLTAMPIRIQTQAPSLKPQALKTQQMHQKFVVAMGAGNRRVDQPEALQSYFSGRGRHVGDRRARARRDR